MKKPWVCLLFGMLVSLLQIIPIAKSTPWSDCHGITPFKEEAELVAEYTSKYYVAWYFEDWSKKDILSYSLPVADIWFFSGHGGKTWYDDPYLVAGDNGKIFGGDIPDLHNQHEFDRMRFAYASACHSAHTGFWSWLPWITNLHDGFINNGARAYMGWEHDVGQGVSYSFTDRFYHYAIDHGFIVSGAKIYATYDVPAAEGNIKLFGDGGVTLIP